MEGSSSGRMGAAEPPEMMAALAQRVRALRAALESSEGETQSTAAVLGSFQQRLSEIEAALRPVQVISPLAPIPLGIDRRLFELEGGRAVSDFGVVVQVRRQAAQMAHHNIDRAIKSANDILAQVVIAREVRACIFSARPLRFSCIGLHALVVQ